MNAYVSANKVSYETAFQRVLADPNNMGLVQAMHLPQKGAANLWRPTSSDGATPASASQSGRGQGNLGRATTSAQRAAEPEPMKGTAMNKALQSILTTARDQLRAALQASAGDSKQINKLERERSTIIGELDQLEGKLEQHPGDEGAIARLQLLREKQKLFDSRIAAL